MEIEIFTLCDYAQDFTGKMVVVGTYDSIHTRQIPAIHGNCCIAARLRFSNSEAGTHTLKIRLIDASGKEIIPGVQGEIKIQKSSIAEHSTINFIINTGNLKFETAGRYSFELYIDEDWRSGLPLIVVKQ